MSGQVTCYISVPSFNGDRVTILKRKEICNVECCYGNNNICCKDALVTTPSPLTKNVTLEAGRITGVVMGCLVAFVTIVLILCVTCGRLRSMRKSNSCCRQNRSRHAIHISAIDMEHHPPPYASLEFPPPIYADLDPPPYELLNLHHLHSEELPTISVNVVDTSPDSSACGDISKEGSLTQEDRSDSLGDFPSDSLAVPTDSLSSEENNEFRLVHAGECMRRSSVGKTFQH